MVTTRNNKGKTQEDIPPTRRQGGNQEDDQSFTLHTTDTSSDDRTASEQGARRTAGRQNDLDMNEVVKNFLQEYQGEFAEFLLKSRKQIVLREEESQISPPPVYERGESSRRNQERSQQPPPVTQGAGTPPPVIQGAGTQGGDHDQQQERIQVSPPRSRQHDQRREQYRQRNRRREFRRSPTPDQNQRRSRASKQGANNKNQRRQQTPPEGNRRCEGFQGYGYLQSPLSNAILQTPLPGHYRVPALTYAGVENPRSFLGRFQYNMCNQGLDQVHMCKIFPELLVDNARTWFDSLPVGSIESYNDLIDAFHRRFFQKAEVRHPPAHLLTIKQGRKEPVSDYMTRFNRECLQVDGVNDTLVIAAFQIGLNHGPLFNKLARVNPQTAQEMWRIADEFARADEAYRRKRSLEESQDDKGRRPADRPETSRRDRSAFDRLSKVPLQSRLGPRNDQDRPRPPQPAQLTRPRAEIFELHAELFDKPKAMTKSSKRRDQTKYCDFHGTHGHDTEDCRDLAANIDALVQEGTLRKYVSRGPAKKKKGKQICRPADKKQRRDPDDDDEEEESQRYDGVISTITALPAGRTKSSLKAESRAPSSGEPTHKRLKSTEVITFSDADPVPAITPHQDAIVISAGVANKLVHRVFIDTGASVSILFKSCYDQLGAEAFPLTPAPLPLRSFVQEDTKPEGIVTLAVTVGKAPTSCTSAVQFYVVKASSPYNIILGRDWLTAVRAVCSTYHLTIKIPTKGGIAVVRGDQKRAKECMQLALRGVGPSTPHLQA